MKEDERCRHPDCVYRNRSDPEKSGNCNYMVIEGRSRTAGLPERLRLPANCPHYKPDGTTPTEPTKRRNWRDEAWKLYRAGATDREIADAMGLKVTRVANMRRRAWHLPPNPDHKGPAVSIDYKRAEELARRGLNDREIAEELGCSIAAIWRWRYKRQLLIDTKRGGDRK